MVTTRGGKESTSVSKGKQPANSRKRKASTPEDNDKENKAPRKTSKQRSGMESKQRQSLPLHLQKRRKAFVMIGPRRGRAVPPRWSPPNAFRSETDDDGMRDPLPLTPPAKNRMNAWEKDERFRKEGLKDPNHAFHNLYVRHKKGPNGSPTFDEAGFQLDYGKITEWMRPKAYNKNRMMNRMDRALAHKAEQSSRMTKAFFKGGKAPTNEGPHMWQDKVSKDLGIPWHKADADAFEEWERKGFPKQKPEDWEWFTDEEKERIMKFRGGCVLRK